MQSKYPNPDDPEPKWNLPPGNVVEQSERRQLSVISFQILNQRRVLSPQIGQNIHPDRAARKGAQKKRIVSKVTADKKTRTPGTQPQRVIPGK